MKVYCILSDERAHRSKSPAIFSNVLRRQGIRGAYVPFVVKPNHIGQAMQSLRILNIAGANITIPYKEAVVHHMDVLSEGANIIGAVNTIVRNGDTLKGYNTNAIGIMDALSNAGFDAEGKSAIVFGTGGAAKAAIFILNWLRTDTIYVSGRNMEKTRELIKRFGGQAREFESLPDSPLPVHIVVNATAVSSDDESPQMSRLIHALNLPECEFILDLNYGRPQNFWQDAAADRKIKFMDGIKPLAYQARRTFALWTNLQVPVEAFIDALDEGE